MAEIKSIVGKDLKEHLNLIVFEGIIDEQASLPYVSKSTIKSLVQFNKKKKNLDSSKNLWKDLIIDSICILKVNDSRERLHALSKNNKDEFLKHFDSIRKSNSYGIDEIGVYFDDFIKFESVLYGTDEHYRDHVCHVLNVWAIGISLICNSKIIFNDDYNLINGIDFHFEIENALNLDKNKDEDKIGSFITKSEIWAMWTLIALCHDLGYPIEKASKLNQQTKRIIDHFGNMNFNELNYSFDIFNTFLVDKFLNILSARVDKNSSKTVIQTKFRDKFSKSLEDNKHGIFSSLLIFKKLTYFLETDFFEIERCSKAEDLRQFHIRKEILRSIASHTCPKVYHLKLNTLSFLLILCDELQEWDRPNFDEFRSNSHIVEPKVFLNVYSMENEQKIHVLLKYNMRFDDRYRKNLVYKRFKNIHNLLRGAKDDEKRKDNKIIFLWDIEFRFRKFSLIFDSNEEVFEILRVIEYKKRRDHTWDTGSQVEIYTNSDKMELKIPS